MNTALFIGWSIVGLASLLAMFRLFGKNGIIAVIAANVVIMNLLVQKSVFIFGLGATGANVLYAMIFLGTDILSEHYGGREARRAVLAGFAVGVIGYIAGTVTVWMQPAPWDYAHESLAVLYDPVFRIMAGSWVAYLASQLLDTYSYEWIRKRSKWLWLRNNGSTWTSQAVDTLTFCSIALWGTMPTGAWLQVVLSTYLLKIVVAALDTPFLYLSKRFARSTESGSLYGRAKGYVVE